MNKPFLFLDIDGVLNSFGGHDVWGDDKEYRLTPKGGITYVVTLSQRMADAINSLDCELWWTTTWMNEAWMVGDLVGLHGGVLDLESNPGWKFAAVQRKLQSDPRPFVWFEDETGVYGTYNSVARKHWPPGFVWNPSMLTGITPEAIEGAREFLKDNR